jgi:hypothetical protein
MSQAIGDRSELLANQLVTYLFENYQGTNHVRRVASWIGFIAKAIESAGGEMRINRSRQVQFAYRVHTFKVRYDHQIGARGGIEIVEVLPLQGQPDGAIVARITNLAEAEQIYHTLQAKLDDCVDG